MSVGDTSFLNRVNNLLGSLPKRLLKDEQLSSTKSEVRHNFYGHDILTAYANMILLLNEGQLDFHDV